MTRRIIAFEVNGKFMISQELNGDKSEQVHFGLQQACELDWSDVVKIFDGSKTTYDFVAAVHSVENAYHYQQIPLAIVDELPVVEELWFLKDGSLQLAYEYGKPVFFYEAYFGNDENEEEFVVVIKTHKEINPEDVTTIRPHLLETSGCEKCTKLVKVSYKFVEDFPDDAIVDCIDGSEEPIKFVPVTRITREDLELTWIVAYDIVGDTVEEKVKNLSEMSSDALADQIYDGSLQSDMENFYSEDFLNEVAKIRDLEAEPRNPDTHITVEQYLDVVKDKNVSEKEDDDNLSFGTVLGKYQDMETKLLALFTKSDYVEEFGWASNDNLYVWVYYIFLKDFVDELTEIVGNGLFDDGGINAIMQDNYLCIDVDELLGSYIDVEELFPKDKYQH